MPIIASDIPYILGFVAVAALGFWLMAWRTSKARSSVSLRTQRILLLCAAVFWLVAAALNLSERPVMSALRALVGLLFIYCAWRNWRTGRPV